MKHVYSVLECFKTCEIYCRTYQVLPSLPWVWVGQSEIRFHCTIRSRWIMKRPTYRFRSPRRAARFISDARSSETVKNVREFTTFSLHQSLAKSQIRCRKKNLCESWRPHILDFLKLFSMDLIGRRLVVFGSPLSRFDSELFFLVYLKTNFGHEVKSINKLTFWNFLWYHNLIWTLQEDNPSIDFAINFNIRGLHML